MTASSAPATAQEKLASIGVTPQEIRRMATVSSVGTALEYFDFTLYSLGSALIFTHLFFPDVSPGLGRILSFATFFIGFAIRPVGGILFGSLGDRLGRKAVLVITVSMMGISTAGIGLLPTAATIGVWAPILLTLLRMLQGLGAGAEAAGASTIMAEYAPTERRGFFGSLPYMGVIVGTGVASLVFLAMNMAPKEVLWAWLWRVPFLLSFLLVMVAFYIRLRLKESPAFEKLKARKEVQASPLSHLLRHSRRHIWVGLGLRIGESGNGSMYKTLAVSYLSTVVLVGKESSGAIGSASLLIACAIGVFVVPLSGWASDRLGRVPVYRFFAWFQILTAIPAWWVLSTGNVNVALPVLSICQGFGVWGMFGVQGAFFPELFGSRHRYSGVALIREVSAVVAGGLAPVVGAALMSWYSNSWVPLALYTMLMAGITVVATHFCPETRGRSLDAIEDAGMDAPPMPVLAASKH